jgi:hypothetical protein
MIPEMAKEISELEAEIVRLKQPPTTSKNSSQPPSRDFKASASKKRRRKRKGAQLGHEKQERPLVDNPDKVIEAYAEHCENCQANLLDQAPVRMIRRQITELPEIQAVVIETRQYEALCPCCGASQRGELPEGLEAGRYFGPRLEATVTYLLALGKGNANLVSQSHSFEKSPGAHGRKRIRKTSGKDRETSRTPTETQDQRHRQEPAGPLSQISRGALCLFVSAGGARSQQCL